MIQKLVDRLFTPEQKKRIYEWLSPRVSELEYKQNEKAMTMAMVSEWFYNKLMRK